MSCPLPATSPPKLLAISDRVTGAIPHPPVEMVAGSRRSTKFTPKQLHREKGFGSFVFDLSLKDQVISNNLKVLSYQLRKQAHTHTKPKS